MTYNNTNFIPLGIAYLFVMSIFILFSQKNKCWIPLIVTACYMTIGQQIIIFGFNFTILRILILVSYVRIFIRKENQVQYNEIDNALLLWLIIRTICYTIQWGELNALTNRMGQVYDIIGMFYIFKIFISDMDTVKEIIQFLSILLFPLGLSMLLEKSTHFNIFSIFGGVPVFTVVREGKLRCQGPFLHAILAGTVGATCFPLFLQLFIYNKQIDRRKLFVGIVFAMIIIVASASSGPILSFLFSIFGVFLWKFKSHRKYFPILIIIIVFLLNLVMKAPIWFIFARLSDVIGMGTGYHRSMLINQFIRYSKEWFLFGTHYTSHWMPYQLSSNPNMIDITNQYIREAVDGGFVSLICFINLLRVSFKRLSLYLYTEDDKNENSIIAWALGVVLATHIVSFFSIGYFDQIIVFWYLLLAIISNIGFQKKL